MSLTSGLDTGQSFLRVSTPFHPVRDPHADGWLILIISEENNHFGHFPRKGVLLHYHFAKLHLYSHVFRGLHGSSLPSHFREAATSAVAAATSIIDMLISDPDLHAALVGMPSYLHSMTAFACMFLAKLVMIHGDELTQRTTVISLTSSLIQLYRSSPVSKWHLVKLMANGLEKMVTTMSTAPLSSTSQSQPDAAEFGITPHGIPGLGEIGFADEASLNFDPNLILSDYTLGASQLMSLSSGPTAFDTTDLSPSYL